MIRKQLTLKEIEDLTADRDVEFRQLHRKLSFVLLITFMVSSFLMVWLTLLFWSSEKELPIHDLRVLALIGAWSLSGLFISEAVFIWRKGRREAREKNID